MKVFFWRPPPQEDSFCYGILPFGRSLPSHPAKVRLAHNPRWKGPLLGLGIPWLYKLNKQTALFWKLCFQKVELGYLLTDWWDEQNWLLFILTAFFKTVVRKYSAKENTRTFVWNTKNLANSKRIIHICAHWQNAFLLFSLKPYDFNVWLHPLVILHLHVSLHS